MPDGTVPGIARLLAVLTLGVTLVGCGSDPQIEYRAENTDDFFAACTDPTTDTVLETRLCQCVIDTVKAEMPFEEFAEIDDLLGAELEEDEIPAETPQVIVDIVADCVVAEADL